MQDFSLLTYILVAYLEFTNQFIIALQFVVPAVLALKYNNKAWLFLYLAFPLVGGIMHYLIF